MKENKFIGCWVSPSFFERIEAFCRKNGYGSKSELLRTAIREKLSAEVKVDV